MLHEIILSLYLGPSGSLLSVDFMNILHPCEKALLSKLLEIGKDFRKLKDFIDGGADQLRRGMYLQAFCDGLSDVLSPYEQDLVTLEKEALEDPHLPLMTLFSRLKVHQETLAILNPIVSQIIMQHLHGCQIMSHVYENMMTGVERLKASLECILYHCHKVMMKQFTSWLMYGELIDPYEEFFIQGTDVASGSLSTDLDWSRLTVDSDAASELQPPPVGEIEYKLKIELLPSYIPLTLACKTLFIGQTIILFKRHPRGRPDSAEDYSEHSILLEQESKLLAQLFSMKLLPVLRITDLVETVDTIRLHVTTHLWKVAVEDADLFGQLKCMKDFFLLGRGEIFYAFLTIAENVLQSKVNKGTNRELTTALHAAARATNFTNDEVLDKFIFKLPCKTTLPDQTIAWTVVKLQYKPPWPLHLLFGPAVLNIYNTLFQFLIGVKKAQLDLHRVWIHNTKQKTSHTRNTTLQLQNNLMFLVETLQYYLQLDVLESQFGELMATVRATNDFENIQHAHSLFLTNVISQTFLQIPERADGETVSTTGTKKHPVNKCIIKILAVSEEFCTMMRAEQYDKVDVLTETLDNFVDILMMLIKELGTQPSGSHLSKLLLRLDYNRYFSTRPHVM